MKSTTIAIDLSKSVFEIAVSNRPGRVSARRRVGRAQVLPFLAELQPATVLMEACGSAHHWGRHIRELGHKVVLLPPHDVRPYVTDNKTDRADAKGLLEAFRNEELHPVPVKSVEQQTIVALHRLRSSWMATRTARLNALRGLLREFGITIPVGARKVLPHVEELLTQEGSLPPMLASLFREVCDEIRAIEKRVQFFETQLRELARQSPTITRLLTIPGVGLLTTTALVAIIGDARRFRSGRQFANFLGLTPRESSSGLKRHLGRISKRGDVYLRMLLIHGARSALLAASRSQKDPRGRLRTWALALQERRGHNKATVALANKIARRVWAVWTRETDFHEEVPEHP